MLTVHDLDVFKIISDPLYKQEVISNLKKGEIYIQREAVKVNTVDKLKEYLFGIGKNSFPNYNPITYGAPNFHRVSQWDPRSTVPSCFHQFVFYPWNSDIFNIFKLTEQIYQIKNILSDLSPTENFDVQKDSLFTRRIAIQFYPSGCGGMTKHKDPVGVHQFVVPIMCMSQKGEEFTTGGAYIEINETRYYTDDLMKLGDVLYFDAQMVHGVEVIDEGQETDWLNFSKGRWMMLLAINSLTNDVKAKATSLEKVI